MDKLRKKLSNPVKKGGLMKRSYKFFVVFLLIILLISCENSENNKTGDLEKEIRELQNEIIILKEENKALKENVESLKSISKEIALKEKRNVEPSEKEEASLQSDIGFKDNTLTLKNYTIKILESRVNDSNHGPFEQELLIICEYTNTSSQPLVPIDSFNNHLLLTQETKDTIERLDTSLSYSSSDDLYEMYEMLWHKVKPDSTVKYAIKYGVRYKDLPIKIEFYETYNNKVLGEILIEDN